MHFAYCKTVHLDRYDPLKTLPNACVYGQRQNDRIDLTHVHDHAHVHYVNACHYLFFGLVQTGGRNNINLFYKCLQRIIFKAITEYFQSSDARHGGREGVLKCGKQGKSAHKDNDRRKVEVPLNFCGQEISLAQWR